MRIKKNMNNTTNIHTIPTMGRTNCGGRCRLLITEQDGKIIDIKGDANYPDKMPCIRGLNYHKTFLGDDRLTTPLKRVGKRGEGKFEPITWKEAVDIITKEWIRIRDTYGPESRYVNYGWGVEALLNGTSLAKRLLRLDGGHLDYYNNYSTACTSYTTPYLYGTTKSGSSFDTLIDSKLIILWAHNPAETRFDNLMYWL
jgi:anaerobic dimethyl sulfoxide reductase subunit A